MYNPSSSFSLDSLPVKGQIKETNDYHKLLNLSVELIDSGPWSGKGLENLWKVISLTDLLVQRSEEMDKDSIKIVSEWKKTPYDTNSKKPAVVNPLGKLIAAARECSSSLNPIRIFPFRKFLKVI